MSPHEEDNVAVLTNLEASRRVAARFAREAERTAESRGLCCNCDVRETCLYRRPDTIVWYCEEYQ